MKKLLTVFALFLVIAMAISSVSVFAAFQGDNIHLCGIVDPDGYDRTGWIPTVASWLSNIPNAGVVQHTAFNETQLLRYLKQSEIFIIHTHGSSTSLRAVDEDGNVTEFLKDDIDALSDNALSKVKLAYLGACEVAAPNDNGVYDNIAHSVFEKGAQCVIGYTVSVYTTANYLMIQNFGKAIGAGYTIKEALVYADAQVLASYGSSGNTSQRRVMGDSSQSFSDNVMLISAASNENQISLGNNEYSWGYFDLSKLRTASAMTLNAEYSLDYDTIAQEYLVDISENHNHYVLQEVSYNEDADVVSYVFCNQKLGIPTMDIIFIMMNSNGDIVAYGKPNEGAFDNITLTQNHIQEAENRMTEQLEALEIDNYSICSRRLIFSDGVLSLRFTVQYEENGSKINNDYIIALN